MNLGAGRVKKEDNIDYQVGIELLKKVGDHVEKDETVAYIYSNDEEKGRNAVKKLEEIYDITEKQVNKNKYILEVIS